MFYFIASSAAFFFICLFCPVYGFHALGFYLEPIPRFRRLRFADEISCMWSIVVAPPTDVLLLSAGPLLCHRRRRHRCYLAFHPQCGGSDDINIFYVVMCHSFYIHFHRTWSTGSGCDCVSVRLYESVSVCAAAAAGSVSGAIGAKCAKMKFKGSVLSE